jgi:hypothetical protein
VAKTAWALALEAVALWQEVQASCIHKEVHLMTLQLACLEEAWAFQAEVAVHQEEEGTCQEEVAGTRTQGLCFRWEPCHCWAVGV